MESGLSVEEVVNRINAWQANPLRAHRVCPNHGINLVHCELPGAICSKSVLVCVFCDFQEDVPKEMIEKSVRDFEKANGFIRMISRKPKIIDELMRRLGSD